MNYEGNGVVEFDRHDIKLVGRGVRAAKKYIPSYRKVKAGLWVLEHWLPSKRFNAKKRRFVEEGREDYGPQLLAAIFTLSQVSEEAS